MNAYLTALHVVCGPYLMPRLVAFKLQGESMLNGRNVQGSFYLQCPVLTFELDFIWNYLHPTWCNVNRNLRVCLHDCHHSIEKVSEEHEIDRMKCLVLIYYWTNSRKNTLKYIDNAKYKLLSLCMCSNYWVGLYICCNSNMWNGR